MIEPCCKTFTLLFEGGAKVCVPGKVQLRLIFAEEARSYEATYGLYYKHILMIVSDDRK
jgi:hypothetical protein